MNEHPTQKTNKNEKIKGKTNKQRPIPLAISGDKGIAVCVSDKKRLTFIRLRACACRVSGVDVPWQQVAVVVVLVVEFG